MCLNYVYRSDVRFSGPCVSSFSDIYGSVLITNINLSCVLQTNINKDSMNLWYAQRNHCLLFIVYTDLENLVDESCKTCKSRS
jgi:hypothetical protein